MLKKIISSLAFILPSAVTRIMFGLLGHKIGKNTKLPIFSYIYADQIEIGNDVDIRPLVFISVAKLSIGNNAILSYGVQIKGDKSFSTKDNSFIGPHCLINCDVSVKIGFYSGLGPRSVVYTHGSFLPVTEGYPTKFKEIVLEDYVWAGMSVVLLPGAYIESNCIINPGVTIKSRIKSNTIVELDAKMLQKHDLSKLQKFLKKDNSYYHEDILKGFIAHYNMEYEYDKRSHTYIIGKKYAFKGFQDTNTIELVYNNSNKVIYDLSNFYTDYCKIKIHKEFLTFLRRRYGLTLRTKY